MGSAPHLSYGVFEKSGIASQFASANGRKSRQNDRRAMRYGIFREITRLYSEFLPENTNLNEQEDPFPRPVVYDNQREIIGQLVRGIARLLSVAREIREDYEAGVFTITHHRHLLENVYYIKDIFHRNMA